MKSCLLNVIQLQSSFVMACSFSPSSRIAASAGLDNVCTLWNVDGFSSLSSLLGFVPLTLPFSLSLSLLSRLLQIRNIHQSHSANWLFMKGICRVADS
jgi:WD40 repeat protein